MTERSRFWDGTATGDASESPYDAGTEFARVLMAISGSGEMANKGGVWSRSADAFAISNPSANTIRIGAGEALVYGTWYENDADVDVNVPTPSVSTRYDYIVLRKSWSSQTVRITRIAGTEGAGAPPALVQTVGVTWDVPIMFLSITTGAVIGMADVREVLGPASQPQQNLLTNGSMLICQRGAGPFTTNSTYGTDRWLLNIGTGTLSVTQDLATLSTKVVAGGTVNSQIQQTLKTSDPPYQTLPGHWVSFSALVSGPVGGVKVKISDGITITLSDANVSSGFKRLWVTKFLSGAATQCEVSFALSIAGTYYLRDAMCVLGAVPVDYRPLHPQEELARCQRYYEIYSNSGDFQFDFSFGGYASASGQNMYLPVFYKQTKPGAATPTVTKNGTWQASNCGQPTVSNGRNGCTLSITSSGAGPMYCQNFNAGNSITIEANP